MNPKLKLFLNVNPNIMHDQNFKQGFTKEYLEKFSIDAQRIVFEITEREAISNMSDFKNTVQNYKNQDYKIAIDDAGAGYSGLNLIAEINPHFIKLDMNLVRDIDKDATKQSLVKCMCEFAFLTDTYLIAEGIETENEMTKLIDIGVHYGQGYFIQRPNISMTEIEHSVIELISEENRKKNHINGHNVTDVQINNICKPFRTISRNILVYQVEEMLKNDPSLPGFCITEDDTVVGVITRNELFKYISGLYGYTLYSNKPIQKIMSVEFMNIDHKVSIDIVAKLAMQRSKNKIYDFITITKEDKYLGIVTIKDLLEKTIRIEVSNARHLNPLSGLPGSVIVQEQLQKCISSERKFFVLYFDLDNFKSYNDVYGFGNGDLVLKSTTEIIQNNIPKDDFVGHIGGDDFVAIVSDCDVSALCAYLINDFDESIDEFYNEEDIKKGYIISKNRRGVEESFPLMSISIAVLSTQHYRDMTEMTLHIAKVKKLCKQNKVSTYLIAT